MLFGRDSVALVEGAMLDSGELDDAQESKGSEDGRGLGWTGEGLALTQAHFDVIRSAARYVAERQRVRSTRAGAYDVMAWHHEVANTQAQAVHQVACSAMAYVGRMCALLQFHHPRFARTLRSAAGFASDMISFDADQFVQIGTTAQLGLTDSSYTVEAWIRPHAYHEEDNTIVGADILAEGQTLHAILRNGMPYHGHYHADTRTSSKLELHKWHHLAFVYNRMRQTQTVLHNGVVIAESFSRRALTGSAMLNLSRYQRTLWTADLLLDPLLGVMKGPWSRRSHAVSTPHRGARIAGRHDRISDLAKGAVAWEHRGQHARGGGARRPSSFQRLGQLLGMQRVCCKKRLPHTLAHGKRRDTLALDRLVVDRRHVVFGRGV